MKSHTESLLYGIVVLAMLAPILLFWWTVGTAIIVAIKGPQHTQIAIDPEYPNKQIDGREYRELGDKP